MISDKAFRKYDIRAIVDEELPINDVYNLAQAICAYFLSKKENIKTIAVGMDIRTHSKAIKEELCKGIIDSGIDLIFIGECATPTLYFASKTENVDAAIMITASHNNKEYNGLKILLENNSVWDQQIQEIREIYKTYFDTYGSVKTSPYTPGLRQRLPTSSRLLRTGRRAQQYDRSSHKGKYSEKNLVDKYLDFLSEKFVQLKDKELNLIIDCGNGCASLIIPKLVKNMNWKNVELLFDMPDGTFPNHDPDPTKEKNLTALKKSVKNFHFGAALDGDCYRLAIMKNDGALIVGDELLTLFGLNLEKPGNIVYDIKCSNSLPTILEKREHKTYISATGHANIKDKMKETNAILGGEISGHFCFKDRYFGYDDAIYALLRFIEIYLNNRDKNIFNFWPKHASTPELRLKCAKIDPQIIVDKSKKFFEEKHYKMITIDGIRVESEKGWISLRASNTEPVLSLRFEAQNEKELNNLKIILYDSICQYVDQDLLRKEIELRTD